MKAHITLLCILSALQTLSAAHFQVQKEEDSILILDESNFESTLASHTTLLVSFYAPWCGHCKKLAPELQKAATTLLKEEPPIRIGMIDAIEEEELAKKHGVTGFPTLLFFRDGQAPVEYEGGRSEREITAYVRKRTGPPASFVSSADFEKVLKKYPDVLVVGFFNAEEMESGYQGKLLQAVAASVDEYEFIHTPDAGILDEENLEGGGVLQGKVVIFKDFDEKRSVFSVTPDTTVKELSLWILKMSTPKLMQFSQDRSRQIFKGPVKQHMLTFVDPTASYMGELKETLTTLADDHRGEILHIYVPSSEDRVMNYFSLEKKELPKTVIVDVSKSDGGAGSLKKYLFTGSKLHTLEDLRQFESDFLAGTLTPILKSEDDKPGNMRGKVKIITGKSFRVDVAENVEHDVFLMFYAPWCGHCKALLPKWDDLGDKFYDVTKESKDTVPYIAKLDATANEIEEAGVVIRGFPTIYFFPADKTKSPELYDGGREVKDFVTFLQRRSTKSFELKDGLKGGPDYHDEL